MIEKLPQMNSIVYFEIQANDPQKCMTFYENIFGWSFVEQEGLPLEYYRINTSGMEGGMFKRPAETPPLNCGTNAFTYNMEVENFDETAQKILENGGIITMPKFAIPGMCWQGYFLDTDNNAFGIFEVDRHAK
ncbi:VOC family protein [Empedobacter falsenii]|nr:VOC family protein [Empedobacter falsenii]